MDWSLIFSTLAWWEWAVYCFAYVCAFSALIWMLWQQRKEHSKIGELLSTNLWLGTERRNHLPTAQLRGKQTVYIATTLGLIVGIVAGYLGTKVTEQISFDDHENMDNVLVMAQHEDGSYTMLSNDGREFETFFCHGKDDLIPGNKLVQISYQQQVGCKNIRGEKLGYSVYTHKDGSRMIFPIPKEQADARK
jgi:hypothetical protein